MKKLFIIMIISVIMVIPVMSQTMEMAESNKYRVYSDISEEIAQFTATAMDEYFKLYNRYFHFNENMLDSKLQIRFFQTKESFDEYLSSIIPQVSNSYVFLQYKNSKRSELVVYKMDDLEKMKKTIIHHGFVQFLKTFIPGAPLWMQKGFAIYFEKSLYNDQDNTVIYQENLDWAVTLKKYIAADSKDPLNQKLFSISDLLKVDTAGANKNINVFYAESWGLVSFLINSKYQEYNRVLWDTISALKPDANKVENEDVILKSSFMWTDKNSFLTDFYFYAESIKSFNELVQDGIKSYSEASLGEAERIFIKAMILNENNYIPYYYMGLINYSRKDYAMAEYYYHSTIERGGDSNLINYALGVNSYANNNSEDAVFYLSKIGSGEYYNKSVDLLTTLEGSSDESSSLNDSDQKEVQTKTGK
jgi:hypothetical protein